MTKVDAIEQVMKSHGGAASLSLIYDEIEKYYPAAKVSQDWAAGIRGVLYRELNRGSRFKKIGISIYALSNYKEESVPKEKIRMHSYIEGICVELGNFKKYKTYTADPSAIYRDNLSLNDFTSLKEVPSFTYSLIVNEVRNIDVLWFNSNGLIFPQKAFEIVDSVGTLNGAFNRCAQLQNINTQFYIVAPEKHHDKFDRTLNLEIYKDIRNRFTFIDYDDITNLYEVTAKANRIESKLFG
ncbi:MAG: hypothetical protein ACI4V5_05340 [Prevotella sp.]